MRNISSAYAAEWVAGLAPFDEQNTMILLSLLATLGIPKTYLDIGSGTGAMVKAAHALGIDAYGVDILPVSCELLLEHDLCIPLDLKRRFSLITSIEVAEHIEPEYADTYTQSIVKHLAEGGTLVFTAAMPGQPGHGHINCQPAEYWRRKFHDLGLKYDSARTHRLALAWSITHTSLHHLEANLQVFNGY